MFVEYIEKALAKDHLFLKEHPEEIYINSSLPEKIHEFEEEIKQFDDKIKINEKTIEKDSARMEKTEAYVKSLTIWALIGVTVACVALSLSALYFLFNSSKLSDAQKKIGTQEQRYVDAQKKYDAKIDVMQRKIDALEKIKENKDR